MSKKKNKFQKVTRNHTIQESNHLNHYHRPIYERKKGRQIITKELILNLYIYRRETKKPNGRKRMKSQKRVKNRDICVLEKAFYQEKKDFILDFSF